MKPLTSAIALALLGCSAPDQGEDTAQPLTTEPTIEASTPDAASPLTVADASPGSPGWECCGTGTCQMLCESRAGTMPMIRGRSVCCWPDDGTCSETVYEPYDTRASISFPSDTMPALTRDGGRD